MMGMSGEYNSFCKILKLSVNIFAASLSLIFNLLLASGIYIDEWRQARVTPILKSGDTRQCENYRPIFILPVVSKVVEKEVFRQLNSYLTELLSKATLKVPIRFPS